MSTQLPELLEPLKEGQQPVVVPIADSTNGESMALATVQPISRAERLRPVRRPISLMDYFDDVLRDVQLGRDRVTGADAALVIARNGGWRYPELARFVVAWEDLLCPSLNPARAAGEMPTFEEACKLAEISEDDLVGGIAKAAHWYGVERARQILNAALPEIMRVADESARLPGKDGHADRKLLMQSAGMIADGAGTTVNVNQTTNVAVVGLPKWEDSDRLLNGGGGCT